MQVSPEDVLHGQELRQERNSHTGEGREAAVRHGGELERKGSWKNYITQILAKKMITLKVLSFVIL